jgi:hypothetical protein
MQKNYRNRVIEKAKPIERELITREVKVFAERCPQCGKLYESLVNQSVKIRTDENLQYGTCPSCRARLCKYLKSDTIRAVR